MSSKSAVWIGIIVGSGVGSIIPMLWGDSVLSFSSVIFSAVGAIIGIYIGFKLSN